MYVYIIQYQFFQDQLHSLTPITYPKTKTHNIVGTQGFNQCIAN